MSSFVARRGCFRAKFFNQKVSASSSERGVGEVRVAASIVTAQLLHKLVTLRFRTPAGTTLRSCDDGLGLVVSDRQAP